MQFDPRSPEFRANPYPYYDLLRQYAPVFLWEDWGMTFLSRHEDCQTLLRDDRVGHGTFMEAPEQQRPLLEMQSNWLLLQNPPDHTRLRGLVHKAFTPRMVEQLRTTIQTITDRLLDSAQANDEMDIIADLAYPLPVTVIAEMIGVPEADYDRFHGWSDALARSLDLVEDEAIYNRAGDAAAEFTTYLRELADRRRVEPGQDLLSALVAVEEEGDRLTEAELYATCALLLVAGHETTINLIGNGTLALLQNRPQWDLLCAQPELAKTAVEELLRYDSPVQLTSRLVMQPLTIGEQDFQPGQFVSVMLGSANRDTAVFANADQLDITRKPNPHLAFGAGIHYCLGAPLARLEGQIAFTTLSRRFPNLRLADPTPRYRENYILRGLEALPVMGGLSRKV